MPALVFGVTPGFEPPEVGGGDDNPLLTSLAATPMALQELPDAPLLGDDWVVLRTRLTGICGSQAGRVDLRPMLTHTSRREDWRDACTTIAKQHETGALKVAFDFR